MTPVALAKRSVVVVALAGCNESDPLECPLVVSEDEAAAFLFACEPTSIPNVELSGPCFVGDAGRAPSDQIDYGASWIAIYSPNPGLCRVDLIFDQGFVYSTEVTFVLREQENPCDKHPYSVPTQRTFAVDNPSGTCVDAGL